MLVATLLWDVLAGRIVTVEPSAGLDETTRPTGAAATRIPLPVLGALGVGVSALGVGVGALGVGSGWWA